MKNDDGEEIVCIQYSDKFPHSVLTANKNGYLTEWDFFPEMGDKTWLRNYKAGCGGHKENIYPPHFADGYIGEYWLAKGASFEGVPKNAKRLEKPYRIFSMGNLSTNPFKVSEHTVQCDHCEVCGLSSGIDYCHDHIYEDTENYELRYKHDNSLYE